MSQIVDIVSLQLGVGRFEPLSTPLKQVTLLCSRLVTFPSVSRTKYIGRQLPERRLRNTSGPIAIKGIASSSVYWNVSLPTPISTAICSSSASVSPCVRSKILCESVGTRSRVTGIEGNRVFKGWPQEWCAQNTACQLFGNLLGSPSP